MKSAPLKRLIPLLVVIPFLLACSRLDTIPYSPAQTPETWLQIQPFVEFSVGPDKIILVQPSTTIIVYLLGVITIAAGLYCFRIHRGQLSRIWWGSALLLWGGGALLAGTSYEAFSYAIKCAGREVCRWTSWWEILYLILSVWSIDAILVAVAYSSTTGRPRTWLSVYAILNALLYLAVVIAGAWVPLKWLVSFEMLLAVVAPGILLLFAIHGWRFYRHRQQLDLVYLGTWLWLGITMAAYVLYLVSGSTASLWERGLWFSENDVLHLGLIIWMLYIAILLAPRLRDLSSRV